MLNVIADIGKVVSRSGSGDVLDFLVPENVNFKALIGLNFLTKEKRIEITLLKTAGENGFSKEVLREFLFLPSEKGFRPQFVVTTPNLSYLLSQTIPNLRDFLDNGNLKEELDALINDFWLETKNPKNRLHQHVVDPKYFQTYSVNFDKETNNTKKEIEDYAQQLGNQIPDKMSIKANRKELVYTILIDGKLLCQEKDYVDFVRKKNLESAFEGDEGKKTCSICGKNDNITSDTTRFLLKFYMTDKINFASYFDKGNFYRAVSLCQKCYQEVIVGERWIDANLRTSLGNFQAYILPQILLGTDNFEVVLDHLNKLPRQFHSAKNLSELREREVEIIEYFETVPFIFNFLFFRKAQSAFKVLTLIKDVPPSRIADMAKAINWADDIARKNEFPSEAKFDLDQIYWLTPIKKKGAEHIEYRKLLQLFDNLFNGYSFSAETLYNNFAQLAHIHRTETYSLYQIGRPGSPDWALKNDTLKWNLFILFLKKLNLFHGGEFMDAGDLKEYFPRGLAELFADLKYNQAQQSLALLGYVVGAVANAQYKENLTNKPILEKISYQGMSREKVERLFTEIAEKIKQYRRHIGYAERWWSAAMKLYVASDQTNLTATERVFYLLSGYAFHLLGAPKKEGTEENSSEIE